jgi:diguanylate cyclase (GGDEF)-like protein
VIVCLAIFGEYSLLVSIHEYFESRISVVIDQALHVALVVIFTVPLMYYFIIIKQLVKDAVTDHLTGIPNRAQFNERQKALIKNRTSFQLLLLDLCKFKEINDTHGHVIGDEVLKVVAKRLTESIGTKGSVARLGGDEFVMLLPGVDTSAVAEDIAKVIRQPIAIHDKELVISVSIGITEYPTSGEDITTLLTNADCAMYNAKRNGLEIFVCHPEDMCNSNGEMWPSRNDR